MILGIINNKQIQPNYNRKHDLIICIFPKMRKLQVLGHTELEILWYEEDFYKISLYTIKGTFHSFFKKGQGAF